MKILIVKLGSLGDTLLIYRLLRLVKDNIKQSILTLVGRPDVGKFFKHYQMDILLMI